MVITVLSPIILPNVFYGKSLLRLIQRLGRVTGGEDLSHPLPLFPVRVTRVLLKRRATAAYNELHKCCQRATIKTVRDTTGELSLARRGR